MNFHELFSETKLVAILRGVPSDQLFELLDCLYNNGIRLAEITYDATDDIPDEVTASDIGRAATYMEERMLIGAGTVIRREQVELTKAMGGKFIISPNMDPEIIRYTKELDMISLPGAMTVSEVCDAVNAGADYVKTSTGFSSAGATPHDIKLFSEHIAEGVKIKAAGGISSLSDAENFINLGASRLGSSKIVKLAKAESPEGYSGY